MKHEGKHHFSHEHIMIPIELDEDEEVKCNACEQLLTEPFIGCPPCQFFLHENCFHVPRSMDHPSHPSHPLTLDPTPPHSYTCNACGSHGKAFGFGCGAHCGFRLHLRCAILPETFSYGDEHSHDLELVFEPPSFKKPGTSNDGQLVKIPCYICNENQVSWLYYCEACEYVAHLKCLLSKYEEMESYVDSDYSSDEEDEDYDDIIIQNLWI
ncbi:hypothetical protein ACP275_02G139100 [Erythranthe tilingii]